MPRIFQLSNGMKLAIQPNINSSLCTVGIWLNEGSRNEDISEHGISHFIEHMMFKGTKSRSPFDIISQIESVGGSINAYTGYETVAYYATSLSEHYLNILEILADIIQNSTFSQEELVKEQDVVIQEINQSIDDPSDNVFDYLRQICYPNQSLGRTILGIEDGIKKFNSATLHDYCNKHYLKTNMMMVIVGNIHPDDAYRNVTKLFDSSEFGARELINNSPELQDSIVENCFEPAKWVGGAGFFSKSIQQVHMAISFPGIKYSDDNYPKLCGLSNILGDGMSSRLFTEIREKHGLAYSVSSFVQGYKDSGCLGMYVITSPDLVEKCSEIIGNEILKIQDEISIAEMNKFHAQVKTEIATANESSYSRAQQISKHLFYYGRCLSLDEMKSKFYSINHNDIIDVARSAFSMKPAIALLGCNDGYDLEKICKNIKS